MSPTRKAVRHKKEKAKAKTADIVKLRLGGERTKEFPVISTFAKKRLGKRRIILFNLDKPKRKLTFLVIETKGSEQWPSTAPITVKIKKNELEIDISKVPHLTAQEKTAIEKYLGLRYGGKKVVKLKKSE